MLKEKKRAVGGRLREDNRYLSSQIFHDITKSMWCMLFIHLFIYLCHTPEIQQQYTEIYNTLKIVYKIRTKLYKRSNV